MGSLPLQKMEGFLLLLFGELFVFGLVLVFVIGGFCLFVC